MVKIAFQLIWKPPRGRNVKVMVLGTIVELSRITLHKVKWIEGFQRGFEKTYAEFEQRVEDPYGEDEDEDDDFTPEEYAAMRKLSPSERVVRFLEHRFEVMEPDPDDTGVENLWQTRPVTVKSIEPGALFSYVYMAWNCDTNRMWACEHFPEARLIRVPTERCSDNDLYVAYSSGFDTKKGESFRLATVTRAPSSRGGPLMSDESDGE